MKGVVLVDINNKEILVSRNVTHHEHIFPYQPSHSNPWSYYPFSQTSPPNSTSTDIPLSNPNTPSNTNSNITLDLTTNLSYQSTTTSTIDCDSSQPVTTTHSLPDHSSSPPTQLIPDLPSPLPSRPQRTKHAPAHLKDFVCTSSTISHEPISSGTTYPISHFHSLNHLSSSHKAFSVSLSHTTEPKIYDEACKSQDWINAMNTELDALAKNQTWSLVDLPAHVKPIGSKWVYKVKHIADGSIY
jgi:hypothetical protein